jgi:hypothetical protein
MKRTAREIGDDLYGLPPSDFTAARDTYVAEAKTAGDRALATELAAFKRPSIAAGLVNLVALRRPEAVSRLIELGRTIRDAQGNVTPIQLRDLSAQRRTELDSVVALAGSLAAERGDPTPSRAVLTEVESTFAAAMADDDAADLVRRGRTLKALSYSGFGQPGDSSAAAVFAPGRPTATSGRPATPPSAPSAAGAPAGATTGAAGEAAAEAAAKAAREAAAEQAERRAAAQERADTARQHLTDTASIEADAEAKVRRLSDQITELRNELEVAQRDARAARQARLAAERALASADRLLHRQS